MNYSQIARGLTRVMALSLLFTSACQSPAGSAAEAAAKQGSCNCGSEAKMDTASTGTVNAKCPIMGGPVDATGELATYKGENVGFCCPGCKPKWESWSASEKDAFIAAVQGK